MIMDTNQSKQIGSRLALLFAGLGLLTAQLIMMYFFYPEGFLNALFWFSGTRFKTSLVAGILLLFLFAWLYGKRAGYNILVLQKNAIWEGIQCSFLSMLSAIFTVSWIGYFQEGLLSSEAPLIDYVLKPIYWVSIIGGIPVILLGVLLGWQIKKRAVQG
jgi:hypothetical protein